MTPFVPGSVWYLTMKLGNTSSPVVVGAAMMGCVLLVLSLVRMWRRRLFRRLDASGNRLCTECGYDLRGHDGPISCPECGAALDVAAVRATWQEFRAGFES